MHCLLFLEISVLFEQASQAVRGNFIIIVKHARKFENAFYNSESLSA